jgi:hypothetical protein
MEALRREMEGGEKERRAVFLDDVAAHLPEQPPSLGQHASCAVVGNGGMLKLFAHGEMIDQHDRVFRINQVCVCLCLCMCM